MISYAKYKTKVFILECSTNFSVPLDDSSTRSDLQLGIKKNVTENSSFLSFGIFGFIVEL